MTTKPDSIALFRELTLADGDAPAWIHVIPAGPDVQANDGRAFRMKDPAAVVAQFSRDVRIDEDHESEQWRGKTKARGWIRELRHVETPDASFSEAGIWGRVDWTPEGARTVKEQEYRYLSPAFSLFYDEDDVMNVAQLLSVALTNRPALTELKALNSSATATDAAPEKQVSTMSPEQVRALCASLGLAPDASGDALLAAFNARIANSANLVPRADLEAALCRAQAAELAVAEFAKASHERDVTQAIKEATEAGKIAPASRDQWVAMCSTKEGLANVKALFGTLPSLVAPVKLPAKPIVVEGEILALSEEDKAIAKMLGLTEAQALANKKLANGGAAV